MMLSTLLGNYILDSLVMAKRISERLAELLNDALKPDRPISASDLWMQHGDYRKARWDLTRWGATVRVNGADRSVCSWDTMTECVRKGFNVTVSNCRMGDKSYANFEIHRNG